MNRSLLIAALFFYGIGAYASDAQYSLIAGMLVGVMEPLYAQPLVTLKNRAQFLRQAQQQLPPLTVREAWRGVGITSFFSGANTGIQTGLHAWLMPCMQHELGSAIVAGVLSSYLSVAPAELIIAQQQLHTKSPWEAMVQVYKTVGCRGFYRGAHWCAGREGIFTPGYLWLAPTFAHDFKERSVPEPVAKILGGITGGIIAMMLSHPADTIKTRMMADIPFDGRGQFRYRTGLDVMLEMLQKEGSLAPLYRGCFPRLVRGTAAITFFSLATPYIKHKMLANT